MTTLASHVATKPLRSTNNYTNSNTNSYSDILKMNKEAESMVTPLLLTTLPLEETSTIAEKSVHSSGNGEGIDAASVSVSGSADSTITNSISSSNVSGTSMSEKNKWKAALSAEEKKAALIEVNYCVILCISTIFPTWKYSKHCLRPRTCACFIYTIHRGLLIGYPRWTWMYAILSTTMFLAFWTES